MGTDKDDIGAGELFVTVTFVEKVKIHVCMIVARALGNVLPGIGLKLDFRPHIPRLNKGVETDTMSTQRELDGFLSFHVHSISRIFDIQTALMVFDADFAELLVGQNTLQKPAADIFVTHNH